MPTVKVPKLTLNQDQVISKIAREYHIPFMRTVKIFFPGLHNPGYADR